jgi:hypothetical protein
MVMSSHGFPPLKSRANVGATFGNPADVDVCRAPGPLEGMCGCANSRAANLYTGSFKGCSAGFVPVCDPLRGTATNGCGTSSAR